MTFLAYGTTFCLRFNGLVFDRINICFSHFPVAPMGSLDLDSKIRSNGIYAAPHSSKSVAIRRWQNSRRTHLGGPLATNLAGLHQS
jgi:hypothetical protein